MLSLLMLRFLERAHTVIVVESFVPDYLISCRGKSAIKNFSIGLTLGIVTFRTVLSASKSEESLGFSQRLSPNTHVPAELKIAD